MSLSIPLSVRSRIFLFFSVSEGGKVPVIDVFFAPFPEKGILDFILVEHRPIIQVFTVFEGSVQLLLG